MIINRKGGVGKKLVADELAFALDAKNVPYCFYDLDGQSGTLHEPVEMDAADISIIDTPGSLQGEMGQRCGCSYYSYVSKCNGYASCGNND